MVDILALIFLATIVVGLLFFTGKGVITISKNDETGSPVYRFDVDDLNQIEKKKFFIMYIKRTKNKH